VSEGGQSSSTRPKGKVKKAKANKWNANFARENKQIELENWADEDTNWIEMNSIAASDILFDFDGRMFCVCDC